MCHEQDMIFDGYHAAKSDIPPFASSRFDFMEHVSGSKIVTIRTDGGAGEYINPAFSELLSSRGIRHERTSPGSSFQNGKVERAIRTLKAWAGASLAESGLGSAFWVEAMRYAVFVYNRLPSATRSSPYELAHGHPPSLRFLHPFGCLCFSRVAQPSKRRLDKKARAAVYLGPAQTTKDGHRILHLDTKHVAISRNCSFFDLNFPCRRASGDPSRMLPVTASAFSSSPSLEDSAATGEHPVSRVPSHLLTANPFASLAGEGLPSPAGRSRRSRVPTAPPFNSADFARQAAADANTAVSSAVSAVPSSVEEPRSLRAARSTPQWPAWLAAVKAELTAHEKNGTFLSIKALPRGRSAIPARWVFKLKRGPNGEVTRYKARLVAKGFRQRASIDFDETFAPTLRSTTFRLLCAFCVRHRLALHQMDVSTAFLVPELDYEIYMNLPEQDIVDEHLPDFARPKLVRLSKALYGLVNSPRLWYQHLSATLTSMDFAQSVSDPCLWVRPPLSPSTSPAAIAIFVDDCAICAPDDEIGAIKAQLAKRYEMTDGGPISWFLGVHVSRSRSSISLSQSATIRSLLAEYNMADARSVSTPADSVLTNTPASGEPPLGQDEEFWATRPYRALVGSLLYLLFTRPDIAFAVGQLTRFLANPSRSCWAAALRVLRYLRSTVDLRLTFRREEEDLSQPAQINIYSDADFAGDKTTRRSCTGYTAIFSGGAISWKSKLQRSVTLSTCEAELVALTSATQEAIWLQTMLRDLFIDHDPVIIHEDNAAAIALIRDHRFSERTKHVEIKYFFLREHVADGQIKLVYVETSLNIADIFTKPLGKALFERHRLSLGLHSSPPRDKRHSDDEEEKYDEEEKRD
jgi:hypothetical protein